MNKPMDYNSSRGSVHYWSEEEKKIVKQAEQKTNCSTCEFKEVDDFGGLIYYCNVKSRLMRLSNYPNKPSWCHDWKKKRFGKGENK